MTNIFSNFLQNIFDREKLKQINFKVLFRNRIFRLNFIISAVLNIILWTLLYFQFKPQEEPVILHYNIYFGIDLIGDWYKIYTLPLFGLVIFFINSLLSVIIYQKEKNLGYFLMTVNSIVQIFLMLSGVFIILQNL